LTQNITSYSAFFYFSFSFTTTSKISGAAKCTFDTTEDADNGNIATCTYGYFNCIFATWEILGYYTDVNKDNGGRQLLRNFVNYVPINTASYPKTL